MTPQESPRVQARMAERELRQHTPLHGILAALSTLLIVLSNVLHFAIFSSIMDTLQSNEDHFWLRSLPGLIFVSLALAYGFVSDRFLALQTRLSPAGSILSLGSSMALFFCAHTLKDDVRASLLWTCAILLPATALVMSGSLSRISRICDPSTRPWRILALSFVGIGLVDGIVYVKVLVSMLSPEICSIIMVCLDAILLVLMFFFYLARLTDERFWTSHHGWSGMTAMSIVRGFFTASKHFWAHPIFWLTLFGTAKVAMIMNALEFAAVFESHFDSYENRTPELSFAFTCLAAIVLGATWICIGRAYAQTVNSFLYLPVETLSRANHVKSNEYPLLMIFVFCASANFYTAFMLINERAGLAGLDPSYPLWCMLATALYLGGTIINFRRDRTDRAADNVVLTLTQAPAHRDPPLIPLALRQPYVWWTFVAVIQVVNLAILGCVARPHPGFFGWLYICLVFSLRSEIVRSARVVLEVGPVRTSVRLLPMLAIIWLGATTSRVILNVFTIVFTASTWLDKNQKGCLMAMNMYAAYAALSLHFAKRYPSRSKVGLAASVGIPLDAYRPTANDTEQARSTAQHSEAPLQTNSTNMHDDASTQRAWYGSLHGRSVSARSAGDTPDPAASAHVIIAPLQGVPEEILSDTNMWRKEQRARRVGNYAADNRHPGNEDNASWTSEMQRVYAILSAE